MVRSETAGEKKMNYLDDSTRQRIQMNNMMIRSKKEAVSNQEDGLKKVFETIRTVKDIVMPSPVKLAGKFIETLSGKPVSYYFLHGIDTSTTRYIHRKNTEIRTTAALSGLPGGGATVIIAILGIFLYFKLKK